MYIEKKEIQNDIKAYLTRHEDKQLLKFITCGSVDDGKSTLIGRLLYDSKLIFEDQLDAIKNDSARYNATKNDIDLSLLVDGLQSEREQGITIDVAYRYFTSEKKKFIIADCPGHEQYTRNMVTGASNCQLAIVIIDSRYGITSQTRRHSYLVQLLGIKHIIVTVNKMDLMNYDENVFNEIKEKYITEMKMDPSVNVTFIPISALNGDNVVHSSENMSWYNGSSLMSILDSLDLSECDDDSTFRMPVQVVNRGVDDFRGYCGTIGSGKCKVGDLLTVYPSCEEAKIKSLYRGFESVECVSQGESVTILLDREIDISRGNVFYSAKSNVSPSLSNSHLADIIWMGDEALQFEHEYLLKSNSQVVPVEIVEIIYELDIDNLVKTESDGIILNSISRCVLNIKSNFISEPYISSRTMGSYILIDKESNMTVAAGMFVEPLQSQHVKSNMLYTEEEIELNRMIRQKYPEWGCKKI
jgi:sulfate adenylyltransferase subunit 1